MQAKIALIQQYLQVYEQREQTEGDAAQWIEDWAQEVAAGLEAAGMAEELAIWEIAQKNGRVSKTLLLGLELKITNEG